MNITAVKHCVGCMACVDRCPKSCISTREDILGHLYPLVDTDLCIDCGACVKVCPVGHKTILKRPHKVIAAWRIDEQLRQKSSSGGLAAVLAEEIVLCGGVVYGCAFVPPFSFRHIRCTTKEELKALRGSKYVQSDTSGIYKQINKDLRDGREVLFIGTPCQTAAVRSYFPKQEHIYVVDLVCHGVPSQRLLRESLPENFTSLGVGQVEFRNNTKYGFSAKSDESIVFSRTLNRDPYLKGFFTALYYRDSCYVCQFARIERSGDLTLGDFWGVNLPELKTEEKKGISLCLINTMMGTNLINRVSEKIKQFERPLAEAVAGNKQLSHPMSYGFRSRLFRRLYPHFGFRMGVICSIPEIILKNWISGLLHKNDA